jgi:two-component system sensor histidine kinase KdpD
MTIGTKMTGRRNDLRRMSAMNSRMLAGKSDGLMRQAALVRRGGLVGTSIAASGIIGLSVAGQSIRPANAVLVFVLLTLLVSATFGFWPGLVASIISNLTLFYFFLEPALRFWVSDPQHWLTLAAFLFVSAIGGSLLETSRALAERARQGQAQAEALLVLNKSISGLTDGEAIFSVFCQSVISTFEARGAAVLVRSEDWAVAAHAGDSESERAATTPEIDLAERAMESHTSARSQSFTPGAHPSRVIMVPFGNGGSQAVLRLDDLREENSFAGSSDTALMAFASEAALAVDRLELTKAASQAEVLKRADELKTAILSSISRQLRTPISTIATPSSSFINGALTINHKEPEALLQSIGQEADELLHRLRDVMRRSSGISGGLLEAGPLRLDFENQTVWLDGDEVHLTRTEFALLKFLAMNSGAVLRHRAILRNVWGDDYSGDMQILRTYMNQLRTKLKDDPTNPRFIRTESGVGYRFIQAISTVESG